MFLRWFAKSKLVPGLGLEDIYLILHRCKLKTALSVNLIVQAFWANRFLFKMPGIVVSVVQYKLL